MDESCIAYIRWMWIPSMFYRKDQLSISAALKVSGLAK